MMSQTAYHPMSLPEPLDHQPYMDAGPFDPQSMMQPDPSAPFFTENPAIYPPFLVDNVPSTESVPHGIIPHPELKQTAKAPKRKYKRRRKPKDGFCSFCKGTEQANKQGVAEQMVSCWNCGRSGACDDAKHLVSRGLIEAAPHILPQVIQAAYRSRVSETSSRITSGIVWSVRPVRSAAGRARRYECKPYHVYIRFKTACSGFATVLRHVRQRYLSLFVNHGAAAYRICQAGTLIVSNLSSKNRQKGPGPVQHVCVLRSTALPQFAGLHLKTRPASKRNSTRWHPPPACLRTSKMSLHQPQQWMLRSRLRSTPPNSLLLPRGRRNLLS